MQFIEKMGFDRMYYVEMKEKGVWHHCRSFDSSIIAMNCYEVLTESVSCPVRIVIGYEKGGGVMDEHTRTKNTD
ncbi:hypothetical protein [Listeria seeligeri]|uniref:hypothetical protein n=1 Tax=Listeria seeligeri TaxID=1640 RepID=UPI001623C2DC|nr:hypothetical protein [Listeria seeligeri]MBC1851178.1 hypothetical protein [Listeria seeligeri]MBC1929338.1 hypothetical protein [Listeria seeligeri]MBF2370274.1 hypothetical protein [Listeria seeligeri]MBF2390472.1 hypothetical protein [Listeria seeligeri]